MRYRSLHTTYNTHDRIECLSAGYRDTGYRVEATSSVDNLPNHHLYNVNNGCKMRASRDIAMKMWKRRRLNACTQPVFKTSYRFTVVSRKVTFPERRFPERRFPEVSALWFRPVHRHGSSELVQRPTVFAVMNWSRGGVGDDDDAAHFFENERVSAVQVNDLASHGEQTRSSVKPRPHQQQCRSNIVECYK